MASKKVINNVLISFILVHFTLVPVTRATPPLQDFPRCYTSGIRYGSKPNRIGDRVSVTCESRGGDPIPTLVWMRGDDVLSTSQEYIEQYLKSENMYEWSLSWIDHASTLQCIESHPENVHDRTCEIDPITITFAPVLFFEPERIDVQFGMTISVTCKGYGNPGLRYLRWLFGKSLDVPDSDRYIIEEIEERREIKLTIISYSQSDLFVTITCQAQNTLGTQTEPLEIRLGGSLTTESPIDDTPYDGYPLCTSSGLLTNSIANVEGTLITATCESRGGDPPSQLQWSRGFTNLEDTYYTDTFNKIWTSTYQWVLNRDDNGITLTCTETHPRLFFPRTCTIGPISVQYSPDVTVNPESMEVAIGNTAYFTCTANGNPSPTVQWYFNGLTQVPESSRYFINTFGTTSSLTIRNVQQSDYARTIMCRANNNQGFDNVYVTLTSPPTTTIQTTTISDIPESGYPTCTSSEINVNGDANSEGQYVRVTCESRGGDPPSQLQWSRGFTNLEDTYYADTFNKIWTSTYQWVLNRDDNGITLTCTETHPRLFFPRTCTIGPISVQYSPDVTVNPESMEVTIGNTAYFTCTANGNPSPTVQWYFNGLTQVPESSRYFINTFGTTSSLTIQNVQQSDYARTIMCRANNNQGFDNVYVTLTSPPTTTIQTTTISDIPESGYPTCTSSEINVNGNANREGQYVRVTCESRGGDPPSELEWSRGSTTLENIYNADTFNKIWTSTYQWVLNRDDNGITLTCTETHPRLFFPRTCTIGPISVQYSPDVTVNPESMEVAIGNTAYFTCTANGNPSPTVQWYFNGLTQVPESSRYFINTFGTTSSLMIQNVQQNDYARTIMCRANNNQGFDNVYVTLTSPPTTTIQTTTISDIPESGYPTCTSSEINVNGDANSEGQYVRVTCESRGGDPPSELQWSRGFTNLEDTYYTDTFNKIWTSTYQWVLNRDDNGITLTCTETHPRLFFPRTCTIGPISVQYSPDVTVNPESMEVTIGNTAYFTCTANGNPSPTVQWYFNGLTQVPESSRYFINTFGTTSSLMIQNVQQNDYARTIMCRANNNQGFDNVYVTLTSPPTTTIQTTTISDIPESGYPTCASSEINANDDANSEGQYVRVTCESRGGDLPSELEWSRGSTTLEDIYNADTFNKIWTSTYQWVLNRDDNGITLTCTETHPRLFFPRTCTIGPISVQYSPDVTVNPESMEVTIGNTAYFTCTANGNPSPTVQWYFNGLTQVPESSRYFINTFGTTSSLTIQNVQQNDYARTIMCRANNNQGFDNVYVTLTSPPTTTIQTTTISDIPESGYPTCTSSEINVNVDANREGEYVRVTCESRGGDPPSQLQWSRGFTTLEDIYNADTFNKIWTSTYQWVLHRDDNGITLTCTETHPRLFFPRTCTIGPISVQYSPDVTVNPESMEVAIGNTAYFTCTANGNPSPTVQWYFNGLTQVPESSRYFINTFSTTTSLTIQNVQQSDYARTIMCRANNNQGFDNVYVTLTSPPTTTIQTTTISDIPESGYPTCTSSEINVNGNANREGEYVRVTCESRGGDPPSQLQWSRGFTTLEDIYNADTFNKIWTSTYQWVLNRDDNGITLTCTETHPRLFFPRTCAIGPISVQYSPDVTVNPESMEVAIGNTAYFTCTANGNPSPTVQWYFNGLTQVPESSRYFINTFGTTSSLMIQNVQQNDYARTIMCRANNNQGFDNVYVTLTAPPTTTIQTTTISDIPESGYPTCTSSEINVNGDSNREGQYVTVTCESRGGDPPSQLQWSRGFTNLEDTYYADTFNKIWTSTYQWVLHRDDNGITLTCTETHPRLFFPRTCTIGPISVQYSPDVTVNPESMEVAIGNTAYFTCTANGNPSPTVQWYFNGLTQMPESSRYFIDTFGTTSSLMIQNVQQNDYARTIMCRANNNQGFDNVYVTLTSPPTTTIQTTTISDIPESGYPTCTSSEINVNGDANREGQYVRVTCESRGGDPPSELEWSRGFTNLEDTYYTDTFNKIWTSTYQWVLNRDDNGITLTCTETHPRLFFPRTCTIGPISVQYSPDVTVNPESMEVAIGNTAYFTCTANGNPSPTVQWYFNGLTQVPESSRYFINTFGTTSSLTIQNVQQSDYARTIMCRANNNQGFDNVYVTLTSPPTTTIQTTTISDIPESGYPTCTSSEINVNGNANREGQYVRVTCESRGGDPPSELEWSRGSTTLENIYNANTFNKIWTSTYQWVLNRDDNGITLTCTETHPRLFFPRTCTIGPISVQYSPDVTVNPESMEVAIGNTAYFTCTANGNPSPTVQWYFNGLSQAPEPSRYFINTIGTTSSLMIQNVQQNDYARTIMCRANNNQGFDNVYVTLTSPPTTTIQTTTISDIPESGYPTCTSSEINVDGDANREGEYVRVTCESRGGDPPSQLEWSRGSTNLEDIYNADTFNKIWTSTYQWVLNRDDNGITLTCTETHPRLFFPRTCTIGPISVQYSPDVTVNPESMEVAIGNTAYFTCTANGNPSPTVQWYFNGLTQVPESSRYFINTFGTTSSLMIQNVQQNDYARTIMCRANNNQGFDNVYVTLTSPPTTTIQTTTISDIPESGYPTCTSSEINVNGDANSEGQYVRVTCESRGGDPPSELQWSRGFTNLEDTYYTDTFNKIWTSTYQWVLNRDDNGITLTCTETHPRLFFPRICTIGPISVQYSPDVTVNPESMEVAIGNTAYFTCTANGNPSPTVQWYFNGLTQVPESSRYFINTFGTTSSLMIQNVQQSDYARTIMCRANNNQGFDNVYVTLTSPPTTTIQTTTISDIPDSGYPTCTSSEINVNGDSNTEGQYVRVTCESRGGDPPSQLQWSRGFTTLEDIYNADTFNKIWTSTYQWVLHRDDNGITLTCTETHPRLFSPRTCIIGPIDVQYRPDITVYPESIQSALGNSVHFTCSATGNPLPTFQWYFNGLVQFPDVSRYSISTTSSTSQLTIENLQSSDFSQSMRCRARNIQGSTDAYVELIPHTITTISPTTETKSIPGAEYPLCSSDERLDMINEQGEYPIIITCESQGGDPPSQLTWVRGDQSVDFRYTVYTEMKISTATYEWIATRDDSGTVFTCIESHERLSAVRTCTIGPIDVKYSPVITVQPDTVDAIPGVTLSFTCQVSANPEPSSLSWYFDNSTHVPDSRRFLVFETEIGVTLTIYDLQSSDAAHVIECRAINTLGSASKFLNIAVLQTTTVTPPSTTTHSTVATLVYPYCSFNGDATPPPINYEGDRVSITCKSGGWDRPSQLQWKRGDDVLDAEMLIVPREEVWAIKFEWTLDNTDHDRVFTCVESHPDLSESRTCGFGPINVEYPPVLVLEPESIQIDVGNSVSFSCRAESNPPLSTILWLFDGSTTLPDILRYTVTTLVNVITLTIESVQIEDFSRAFVCQATNERGYTSKELTLQLITTTKSPIIMTSSVIPKTTTTSFTIQQTTIPSTTVKHVHSGENPVCTIAGLRRGKLPNMVNDHVSITCLSQGGQPTPILEWRKNGESVNSSVIFDERVGAWISVYNLELSWADNDAIFTCVEIVPGTQQELLCDIAPINVIFTPVVILQPPISICDIGMKIVISCEAFANPKQIWELDWLFDGAKDRPDMERYKLWVEGNKIWLAINNMTAMDLSYDVSCQARNMIGISTVDVQLIPPENITIPTRPPKKTDTTITMKTVLPVPDKVSSVHTGSLCTIITYFIVFLVLIA
ncbi:hemicentin-1-like [Glandiceps talaboti]